MPTAAKPAERQEPFSCVLAAEQTRQGFVGHAVDPHKRPAVRVSRDVLEHRQRPHGPHKYPCRAGSNRCLDPVSPQSHLLAGDSVDSNEQQAPNHRPNQPTDPG